jgi:hypothetical protein
MSKNRPLLPIKVTLEPDAMTVHELANQLGFSYGHTKNLVDEFELTMGIALKVEFKGEVLFKGVPLVIKDDKLKRYLEFRKNEMEFKGKVKAS